MSQGKENPASLQSKIRQMKVQKPGVTRSGRPSTSRYAVDEGARVGRGGGRGGRGGGRAGGQGGGQGGGYMDHTPSASEVPSASGDVASQYQLEDEVEDEAQTESRHEVDVEDEVEDEVEAAPKRPRMRGEAGVPEEDKEPKSEEAKAIIIPKGVE